MAGPADGGEAGGGQKRAVAGLTNLGSADLVEQCAALASLETPDFEYAYEDCSSQEARDRILAELSRGEGPEILYVDMDDLELLAGKGLLLELQDLIPEETKKDLLPAALELGAVDGKLLGMPVRVTAETLIVSREVWDQDSWKLEDVIGLLEEGKLEGAVYTNLGDGSYAAPAETIMALLKHSLNDSFLIDWESGESHFEDERFIRLLEIARDGRGGAHTGEGSYLNGGNTLLWSYFMYEGSFIDFWGRVESEKGNAVGFPTSGTCGSYLLPSGGVVVVNAGIGRTESAVCFLETLLGEELQSKNAPLSLSVRKIVPEELLVEGEDGKIRYYGGPEVAVLQDGSTSIHRGASFLEGCTAPPSGHSAVTEILIQEIQAMLTEGKSARDVAEIIDNRVQLYLDEGK